MLQGNEFMSTPSKLIMETAKSVFIARFSYVWRQCGRVVRAPDLESGGPGFKSRSDHYLELFLGSPKFNSSASLVK